jgi:hypothetical protein
VSGYGLDDRAIEVRYPAGARIFPLTSVSRRALGAHPASCTMGTGGPFPGGVTLTTHPHLVPRSRMSRSYIYLLSPQAPPWRVAGLLYFFFTLVVKWILNKYNVTVGVNKIYVSKDTALGSKVPCCMLTLSGYFVHDVPSFGAA